jgi:hypothetical protein
MELWSEYTGTSFGLDTQVQGCGQNKQVHGYGHDSQVHGCGHTT